MSNRRTIGRYCHIACDLGKARLSEFFGLYPMETSFTDAVQRFLDHCRIARTLSPHTLKAYEADLAHARTHLCSSKPVTSISREELRRYAGFMLREQRLKEASVKRRMATVRQLFKWLEREELLAVSPFHRLDLIIRLPRRLPRALAVEDIRRLLAAARQEALDRGTHSASLMYFVLVTLFVTGLRVGELANTTLADVNEQEGVLLVRGKGNRERHVYLVGDDAKAILRSYLLARRRIKAPEERLLVSAFGAPVSPQYIRRRLAAIATRADLSRRVTPHMLRHTAATQLIEAGVDIRFVQKLLGHASIATTQIYTQVSDSSLRATLERADTLGRMGTSKG